MQHYAIVTKLKLTPIEGAKTLQQAWYYGMPFAVGKELTEDDLVLIFLPDSQLSHDYCIFNNLYAVHDANGKNISGGYFEDNRKVRTVKFMQGKLLSVGFVASLDTLKFTEYDISKLKEGDSFNELNGIEICRKYTNPKLRKLARALHQQSRVRHDKELLGLSMHPDTQQLFKYLDYLEVGDLIVLTLKMDGTSVRVGNALVERKLSMFEKLFYNKYVSLIQPLEETYKLVTGTRRVIINDDDLDSGYYGNHRIYTEVMDRLEGMISPGESVYAEIVGWLDYNVPMFNRGGVVFDYGLDSGKRDFYIYNIKWTLKNGMSISLPWNIIKQKATYWNVKHVLELAPPFIYDGNKENLLKLVMELMVGSDPIGIKHIREGVAIRVEQKKNGTLFFKAKSHEYYALEDKSKLDKNFTDVEELQEIIGSEP